MRPPAKTDLRRAISRPAWLANRARNALHRPAFIGAVSVATFVTALVSLVVVPRSQRERDVPVATTPRPDTISLLVDLGAARMRVGQVDSALIAGRQQLLAEAERRMADSIAALRIMDSLGISPVATRDSLQARLALLNSMLARAQQAPLPSSYRSLAQLRELRDDPRVRALLDSLDEVEREREAFGAIGGVDPVFVVLTGRLNDLGRAIASIGAEKRSAIASELSSLQPLLPAAPQVATVDTMAVVAARDSARAVARAVEVELARRRRLAQALDLQEKRAREEASAVAPPLAMLAAAFVLSAVFGFGTAMIREVRRPHVADASEVERVLGVRVLSVVESTQPSVERGRREADRAAPPYFDPLAEGYQLAYLGIATGHPALLTVTVGGDNPAITAVVACNLAAVAVEEARNTLVIDLDREGSASAALRSRVTPGFADVVRDEREWPDVTISAPTGRNRSVDLVPRGLGPIDAEAAVALLKRDAARLARYYDAVVVVASPEMIAARLAEALPSSELVYCAQPGVTPLRELREELNRFELAGAKIKGLVLWGAERPVLPAQRELAKRSGPTPPRPVPAGARA